jgi:hypothetical protein
MDGPQRLAIITFAAGVCWMTRLGGQDAIKARGFIKSFGMIAINECSVK